MTFFNIFKCPKCGSTNVDYLGSHLEYLSYLCKDCGNKYTIEKKD